MKIERFAPRVYSLSVLDLDEWLRNLLESNGSCPIWPAALGIRQPERKRENHLNSSSPMILRRKLNYQLPRSRPFLIILIRLRSRSIRSRRFRRARIIRDLRRATDIRRDNTSLHESQRDFVPVAYNTFVPFDRAGYQ